MMTKEDKELLLKDLCSRLSYGVFIQYHWSRKGNTINEDRELDFSDVETLKYNIENPQNDWCEISWKPYLRPMSSITEEELKELAYKILQQPDLSAVKNYKTLDISFTDLVKVMEWLNAHYLDYRGLIEKGLALEAPEDMYKN